MRLTFVTVDVFTDRAFGGNPLAVVLDASGLTSAQMQAIAAEFNLAETTFVLPPKDPSHTAQVRIFTPRAEMPFAGHPNVGTAFALAREGTCHGRPVGAERMVFEELAGLVPMEMIRKDGVVAGARLAAPQPLKLGETVSAEIIAEACGLAASDIETRHHAPRLAGCGATFVFAELKDRRTLAAARPRDEVFARHLPREKANGVHLYVRKEGQGDDFGGDLGDVDIQCRMFAPRHGIYEDPATGSANVALIGLLAALRPEPDLTLEKTIAQGVDMGRPSLLEARAEKAAGAVTATYIGGTCVPMMRGTLDVG
jgi:trans-2,3-dihydro-3-hydroxyanthranilate isomerase